MVHTSMLKVFLNHVVAPNLVCLDEETVKWANVLQMMGFAFPSIKIPSFINFLVWL